MNFELKILLSLHYFPKNYTLISNIRIISKFLIKLEKKEIDIRALKLLLIFNVNGSYINTKMVTRRI